MRGRHTKPSWDWRLKHKDELVDELRPRDTAVHGFSLLAQRLSRRLRLSRSSLSSVGSGCSDGEHSASEPLLHDDHHDEHRRHRSIFGLPLLLPSHWLCLVQLLVMGALDTTYTAFKVPITFAVLRDLSKWSVSSAIDIFAGAFFTADMFLNFHIAHPVKTDHRTVHIPDGAAVAREYIFHGTFAIDFLATLPAWIELSLDELHENKHNPWTVLNMLRMLRLLRLGRFVQSVFVLSLGGQVGRKLMGWLPISYLYLVNIVYAMLVLINLMGCTWLFVAETEAPGHSWLCNVDGEDLSNASALTKYISAVHFATTTMATVGYGDVSPNNNLERCVAMFMMIVGVMFFGFMIGALGSLLQHAGQTARRATLLHNKIQDVEAWMTARHLPRRLRKEAVAFFCDAWIGQADVHEAELLAELPPHLKGKIVMHLLRDVFANSSLFSSLDASAQAMLSAALIPKPLLPGHDLCHPGDPTTCLWILQKGIVAAVTRTGENAEILYAPAVLGEASLLTDKYPGSSRRSCGFRAHEACMVWELGMDELQGLLFTHPKLKEQILDGFYTAVQQRMLNNPRARWKAAMHRLRGILRTQRDGKQAAAGNGQEASAMPADPDAALYNEPGSPSSSASSGSEEAEPSNFQHSLDAMYNKEMALALADTVAQRLQKQREAASQEAQSRGWEGVFPAQGGDEEQGRVSPFAELQRASSRVQFSL